MINETKDSEENETKYDSSFSKGGTVIQINAFKTKKICFFEIMESQGPLCIMVTEVLATTQFCLLQCFYVEEHCALREGLF